MSTTKAESNRRNALKSTGPRTERGKQRSARNAVRHGLSVSSIADPHWAPSALAFAKSLVSDDAPAPLRELAYKLAAAHVDFIRARRARHDLIAEALADESFMPAQQRMVLNKVVEARFELPQASVRRLMAVLTRTPTGDFKMALVVSELETKLEGLDRYERRAFSRRWNAIRAFDRASRRLPGSLVASKKPVGQ